MKRTNVLITIVIFVAFAWILFGGGALGPTQVDAAEPLKAAFIYVGPIGDLGWSWEHDTGRKMLEKEGGNIDAISVSTPDHTHTVAALTAMELGKHVYVQKPLTHSIKEARMLD